MAEELVAGVGFSVRLGVNFGVVGGIDSQRVRV